MLHGPTGQVPLAERPVPTGPWAVSLGNAATPPSAEQAAQIDALRGVLVTLAAMLGILSVWILFGAWRHRIRLRRSRDFVHWAVGARRAQFIARAAGEGRWWLAGTAVVGLALASGVPHRIGESFPGVTAVSVSIGPTLLLIGGITSLVFWLEGGAGRRAARAPRLVADVLWSKQSVTAFGFAVLTGVGLMSVHAPAAPGGDVLSASDQWVVDVSLEDLPVDERARAVSGWVTSGEWAAAGVGLASAGFARGAGHTATVWVDCGDCWVGLLPLGLQTVTAEIHAVAPDTFPRVGISILFGRDFTREDQQQGGSVAIVSRTLAQRHFEDGQALGRQLRVGDSEWATVIGVVEDQAYAGAGSYSVYLPVSEAAPPFMEVLGAGSGLSRAVAAGPTALSLGSTRSFGEIFEAHSWFAQMITLLGAATLMVVLLGVSVVSASEARDLRFEIALRRALGATRVDIVRFVAWTALRGTLIAVVLGIWLSLIVGSGLRDAHDSIPAVDPLVWAVVALMVAVAHIVGTLPALSRIADRTPGGALERAA
jgi:hypothetical protein